MLSPAPGRHHEMNRRGGDGSRKGSSAAKDDVEGGVHKFTQLEF